MNPIDNCFRFQFAESVILKESLGAEIGTVTTKEPDSEAEVSISKNENTYVFNFGIPKGKNGKDGENPVIDSEMSDSSENAVKNSVIKEYVDEKSSEAAELSKMAVVQMTQSDTAVTLSENIFYVFPTMTSLNIDFAPQSGSEKVAEYRFRFTSGASATVVSLPSGITGEFTVNANATYEVSVVDGYLVYLKWEAL